LDDPGAASADVYLIDLARNVPNRLTTNPTNDASVLWAPDSGTVTFRSNREGYTKLYEKRPGGTGPERLALDSGNSLIPTDWSRDGRTILFASTTTVSAGFRLWRWSPADNAKPTLVVDTPQNAMHGRLSPAGTWLAYASDDSGRLEVYVQPFPGPGDRQQISADGGAEPRWRADGRELFYLAANGAIMSVDIPMGNALDAGVPRPLFDVRVPLAGNPYRTNYDIRADGQRFLVNTRVAEAVSAINVILNWPALLKK
jgi:Tol biopolymer transport system component